MFKNIIGQTSLKHFMSTVISKNELSIGYIIEGSKYMGKEFIAEQIANEVTSPNYINKLFPTEDRKNLAVEDIREMIANCYNKTYNKQIRVYIIPNADTMNIACQNAFLKTLEEPPTDCLFIMLVEDSQNLLETIRSRSVVLKLAPYTETEIKNYLKNELEVTDTVIKLSNGTINRYEYLNTQDYKDIEQLAYKILSNIKTMHPARIFAIIKHIEKLKEYASDLLTIFSLWYHDIYLIQHDMKHLIELKSYQTNLEDASTFYSKLRVEELVDEFELCRIKLSYNCNLDMAFSCVLIKMKVGELNE